MSDWYGLDTLEEAYQRSRDLLLPFNWKTWARLMVISIFVGSGGGFNLPTGGIPDTGESRYSAGSDLDARSTHVFGDFPDTNAITGMSTASSFGSSAFLAYFGLILLGIILFLFYLNSVFSFIFYQSLLDEEVRIIKNFRRHAFNGLLYLLFRIGILLGILLLLAVALIPMVFNSLAALPTILAWIILAIAALVLLGLTDNFIVVRVIETDHGFISGWKSFYPELKAEWRQLVVYVLARLAVKIAVGAIGVIWILLSLLIVGIPLGILGVILFMVFKPLVLIPVIIGLLLWLVLILAYRAPAQTFLNYYAILVYRRFTG